MKGTRNLSLLVILGLVLIMGVWGCSGYNGLISADQNVKKVWGNVETNYQRRTDLYSSVIKTVEASANFEKSTLQAVVEARAKATSVNVDINDPKTLEAYQQAQTNLQGSFSRLIASFEQYPDLKANQNCMQLQEEIVSTENKLAFSKQSFNDSIEKYNASKKSFFASMVVGFFKSKLDFDFPYWQISEDKIKEQENYTVKL